MADQDNTGPTDTTRPTDRDPGPAAELRSFGRRSARRLRPRQARLVETVLPNLTLPLSAPAPEPLSELFPRPVTEAWLEIGFGGGEHLVWQARHNPRVGLIGCEPFIDGVAKVLGAIDNDSLSNIRLHTDDARDVIRWLPEHSISRAFVLFPDPWPKMRHRKRRLVTRELCDSLARVMRPGAELRMASDIGDYAVQMLESVLASEQFTWCAQSAADWRTRPADWPETRYEQKAVRAGRRSTYLRFRRLGD